MFPEGMSFKRDPELEASLIVVHCRNWQEISTLRALPLIARCHDVEPYLVHHIKWWEAPNRLENTVK